MLESGEEREMRKVLLALFSVLLGCSSGNPTGSDAGSITRSDAGSDAGSHDLSDSGTDAGIPRKITVHTYLAHPNPGDSVARVLIGDGAKFSQPVDVNGDALFEDPSLSGPQTVTVIAGGNATTIFGINSDEIWIPANAPTPPAANPLMHVNGSVTGILDAGDQLSVRSFEPFPSLGMTSGGSFSFDVYGDPYFDFADAGTPYVVAGEYTRPGHVLQIVGLTRLQPGETSGVTIALDHPVDQTITANVVGLAPYGASSSGRLYGIESDMDYGEALFSTTAIGDSTLVLPAIETTAPFDQMKYQLTVIAGDSSTFPAGQIASSVLVGAGPTTVALAPPVALTGFTLGSQSAPTSVALQGFSLGWSADPSWRMVRAVIQQSGLTWTVNGPGGDQHFDFFPLPADMVVNGGLAAGTTEITLTAWQNEAFPSLEAYWKPDELARGVGSHLWQTQSLDGGYVNLQ